jgi:hypothetical protein
MEDKNVVISLISMLDLSRYMGQPPP